MKNINTELFFETLTLNAYEGEIVPTSANIPVKYDDSIFETLATTATWLPRIMLYQSGSDAVKQKKATMGEWGVVKGQSIIGLGEEFDCAIVAWQPKAMRIIGDTIISVNETPIVEKDGKKMIDPTCEFAKIMAESDAKDSGCLWGQEFLLYVPQIEGFATLYMSTKTMRREAPNVKALMGKAATFKVQYIEGKGKNKFTWYGPVVTMCSTQFDVPSPEEFTAAADKFLNPPKSDVEVVEETAETRAR
jgi:hypothetical protein